MGLITAIQHKDFLAIAGDSRATYIDENGEVKAHLNNIKSLFQFDNKIISTSGDVNILSEILREYRDGEDKTIECLRDISVKYGEGFRGINPDLYEANPRIVDLIIFTWQEGESIVYNISSFNNYKISRNDCRQGINNIALGFSSDQALKMLDSGFSDKKYFEQVEENRITFNTENFFQDIYDNLACTSIGGLMNLYILDKNGVVKHHTYQIKDVD